MIQSQKRVGIVSPRTCVIALLINLLVFPPSIFADGITWTGGGDGSTYGIGANWTGGNYPNGSVDVSIQSGGALGPGVNANVTLDSSQLFLEQGVDAVSVDSLNIRGGHVSSTASLTVQTANSGDAPNLTIGNPSVTQGNVLNVGNRGSLNVTGSATTVLDLSGGGGSISPGAANSVGASIWNGGSVNISELGTLGVQNSFGGTRIITNNGVINVGGQDGAPATLAFSSVGASQPTTFVLGGNGTINMNNFYTSSIVGTTGTENLVVGAGQTIQGSGFVGQQPAPVPLPSTLGSLTNYGTLTAAPVGEGLPVLVVTAPLTNYDSSTSRLTNGSYNAQGGAELYLTNVGSVQSLNLANVQLQDVGVQKGGFNGIIAGANFGQEGPVGNPDALATLTHVTDGTVDLQGSNETIAPSNQSGTLTLRSDPLGLPTNLTVEQDSAGNASTVTIAGNLKNESQVYGASEAKSYQTTFGAVNGNPGTTVYDSAGSSINVSGSSLTVTGNLSNEAKGTPGWSNLYNYQEANSNINIMNSGSLTVGGNLTTRTNGWGNSTINLEGYDNGGNPVGASLTVNGNLRNGGGFGTPMSQGADSVYMDDGSLTVNGNFTNNNAGYASFVGLSNSSATVSGWFGQFQGNNTGSGASVLDLENSSTMTVGNLRNSTGSAYAGTSYFQPQSNIVINGGSLLSITGTFANLSNGTLTGGSYTIGGPSGSGSASVLNYNGAANTGINAIDTNTALTLSDMGPEGDSTGVRGQITNNGADALSPYLNTVNGSLTLLGNSSLNLTSTQGLTIGSTGQVTLGQFGAYNTGSLSATGLTNNGIFTDNNWLGNVTVGTLGNLTGGTLTGGTWNLAGALYFGQGTDSSTSINQISGATISLAPSGEFANGTSASSTNALNALTSVVNGSNLTFFNPQSSSFNSLNIDASTLNLYNGASATFGGNGGTGLSLTNNGTLNVGEQGDRNNSVATLNFASNTSALVDGTSQINVNDNGTLSLTGGTTNAPGILTVNGNLNINGVSSAGALSVSDGGSYHVNGTGNVTVSGLGQMNVSSGNLLVSANLTNWTPAGSSSNGLGTLSGGTYNVGKGATLTLQSIGAGNSIQDLTGGANIIVRGGLITGDGTTNALLGMTEIDGQSSLDLRNMGSLTITPGTSGAGANTFFLNVGGGALPTWDIRNNTNVQLNGNFLSSGGNLNITSSASLNIGGSFLNIDSNGNFGANDIGPNPLNLTIGSASSLTYNGADITSIVGGSSLTLRDQSGSEAIFNTNGGSHDALSNTLTTVNGALNLDTDAALTLTGNQSGFTNDGSVSLTNGSALDVSAVGSNFANVDGSGNLTGNFLVGGNSTLTYKGADITAIGTLTTDGQLTLDGGNGQTTGTIVNTNSVNPDALSATLNSVTGSSGNVGLTLQNGASLTLTGAQGTFNIDSNFGVLNVTNGSLLDVSKVGSGFGNVDSNGNLTGHSILVGSNSALNYNGANISTINGSITLDNTNGGNTGSITNNGNDALSGYLTGINGSLSITNNANLELSQALTVNPGGNLNVDNAGNGNGPSGNGGSTLTLDSKLTNYNGNVYVGGANNSSTFFANGGVANKSDDNNSDKTGNTELSLAGAYTPITGNLFNGAFTPNGGYANARVDMTQENYATLSGNLTNLALLGTAGNSSNATLNLDGGSYLSVNGNVKNIASKGQFDENIGGATSLASVKLTNGSRIDVTGTFKNYSGGGEANGGSLATVNVSDAGYLSVGGLFTNSGGSVVNLDNDYGNQSNGGSQLIAQGGFNNYNSSVFLNFNSQMQVANGFQNLSDDSANAGGYGYTCLAVGSSSCSGEGLAQNPQSSIVHTNQGSGFPSEATITGGLVNSATTSNAQPFTYSAATSAIFVASGSYLNADNLTNSATAASPSGYDYATATLTLGARFNTGGTLNVTGNVTNTASMPVFAAGSSFGNARAEIDSYGGTMTVGGTFTQTSGILYMDEGATATVAGMFTNDANSSVTLANNELRVQNTQSPVGTVSSNTNILGTTTLNVTGEFENAGSVSIGANTALNVVEDSNSDPSAYNQTGGITTLYAGGTLSGDNVNITGGTLQGIGGPVGGPQYVATVDGNLTIGENATLNLYDQNNPPDPMALDVVGDYTMLGMLDLSLNGVGLGNGSDDSNNAYDQVDVTGNVVALDGALNLNLESGFLADATVGDVFNILNWTGTDGSTDGCTGSNDIGCFGTFNDVTFADSQIQGQIDTFAEQINTDANGQELDLVVTGVSATPEPGTLSLLFCAMLIGGGVTWYRRRRKNVAE